MPLCALPPGARLPPGALTKDCTQLYTCQNKPRKGADTSCIEVKSATEQHESGPDCHLKSTLDQEHF